MKVGIHGRNDYWTGTFTESDYRVIRQARIELVKMLEFTRREVFQRLRDENPHVEFIVRLHEAEAPGTPAQFVARHAPRIAELRPFTRDVEILNEPNFPGEGWGPDEAQAHVFDDWYLEVLQRLRAHFPQARFGFPGLSPTLLPGESFTDLQWLEVCREAVEQSDWLGCHCYWSDLAGMLHPAYGLRFTAYHDLFPDKTIHITEFNNDLGRINHWQRSLQYAQYYEKVGDYPYVASACAFLISSPDTHWEKLAWWEPGSGQSRPVVWRVGEIPRPVGGRLERPAYAVSYRQHNTPRAMIAGQTNAVRLVIENAGRKTWLADGYNRVRLGYHWYRAGGGQVPVSLWADLRTPLPHDLRTGQQVTLDAELGAPQAPGHYVLKWDVVEEMVTWFAWQGVPTLDVEIEVKSGGPEPPPPTATLSASHNSVTAGPDNLTHALDGNVYTRWSTRTPQRPGMWFQWDLGRVQTVAQVRLSNAPSPHDYPRGYVVKLSRDGRQWATVAANPDNHEPLVVNFSPRPARYVRVEQTGSDRFFWWSIHEASVSAETATTARASHNDVTYGADNLGQALDGNRHTRWSTRALQVPGMWFELDLGAVQTVRGLKLDDAASPHDYPRGYVVRLSSDRRNWEEVASNPNNSAPLDVTFAPRRARYVRVEQTGRSDRWWWSIHGVEVKGSKISAMAG